MFIDRDPRYNTIDIMNRRLCKNGVPIQNKWCECCDVITMYTFFMHDVYTIYMSWYTGIRSHVFSAVSFQSAIKSCLVYYLAALVLIVTAVCSSEARRKSRTVQPTATVIIVGGVVGHTVRFFCNLTTADPPNIQWFDEVYNDGETPQLIFSSADESKLSFSKIQGPLSVEFTSSLYKEKNCAMIRPVSQERIHRESSQVHWGYLYYFVICWIHFTTLSYASDHVGRAWTFYFLAKASYMS